MAKISRVALLDRLDGLCTQTLESAAELCAMRGNPYIEIVHWLSQIFHAPDSDLQHIVNHFHSINVSKLASDLVGYMDRLPRGATSVIDFSSHVDDALQRAWVHSALMFNADKIRTGHLIAGIVNTDSLRGQLMAISPEFARINADELCEDFYRIVKGSPEITSQSTPSSPPEEDTSGGGGPLRPQQGGKALEKYSVDLTAAARAGELDPIRGRDDEISQMVDILMRRRQNNPILTGEAGVGKTAVVEGFAQRIVQGNVPPPLRNVTVRTLDLGLLQAGAGVKGEFESRLRQVIDEVQASPTPIILFIDEAHTLIGAGGQAGQGDAANLLKPALARGKLRTIAATTWAEYKRYIERDPALTRRFEVVKVGEPVEERCLIMLRGVKKYLEKHHNVEILDEAVDAAVRFSARYIPARQLPDKAVSLLDTACARVAVGHHAVPAEVNDSRRQIEAMETELEIIDRESLLGLDHAGRKVEIAANLATQKERLVGLEKRWLEESELVKKIVELSSRLQGAPAAAKPGDGQTPPPAQAAASSTAASSTSAPANAEPAVQARASAAAATASDGATPAGAVPTVAAPAPPPQLPPLTPAERAKLTAELTTLQQKLEKLQGETPLIHPRVSRQTVASVVAAWTGVPVGRMVKNEIDSVLNLADTLSKRVVGQRHGLEAIARIIHTARMGMQNRTRPIGVFLLAGPSGVGKTETALSLAETLYGGEQNLITINMSEFGEAHTVSTLKGAPPGYVGYGEGGVLTEAVRRRPYSVVLLDEIEKAHTAVHQLFFQVFDKGMMEDGEGRLIDFKNTIFLLTSNTGTELIRNLCKDPALPADVDAISKALRAPLKRVFSEAFLGRMMAIVPYLPISEKVLLDIIRLQLGRVGSRVAASQKVPFTYDEEVVTQIASRCTETESGARAVDTILTHTILPQISREFLVRLGQGDPVKKVHVGVADGQFKYVFQ